jgi:hypothetical protein
MASPLDDPIASRQLLEAVPPALRGAQLVQRDRIEASIALVQQPLLRQAMMQAFHEMLQGTGQGFTTLRGKSLLRRTASLSSARFANAPTTAALPPFLHTLSDDGFRWHRLNSCATL